MRLIKIPALLIALCFAAALPVHAAGTASLPPDQVVLDLVAEDWVETATARLMVRVTAAVTGDQVGGLRNDIKKALGNLASDVKWRITGFHRSRDKTGLERANASAEARVKEAALGNVHDKARSLSRPGMQVVVAGIDFSPTLEEREAVVAALRSQIYTRVREETQRLGRIHEGRSFRLRLVDFAGDIGFADGRPMRARQMTAEAVGSSSVKSLAPALNVSQRIVLRARVILAAD